VGDQLMLFRWPDNEEGLGVPMTAEDAVAGGFYFVNLSLSHRNYI